MHDRLNFQRLRETHPDRYRKVDLLVASIVPDDERPDRWVIRRIPSADPHVVELVRALDETWGQCDCPGFQHHDGPCSHLAAVWRAWEADRVEIPVADPTGIEVDVRTEQQELADAVDGDAGVTNEVATDGGRR